MANQEQLEILKQGVDVWNKWREDHPEVEIDLKKADLRGTDLTGADLTGAGLRGALLTYADLTEASLPGADLTRAYLRVTNLTGADLAGANLTRITVGLTVFADNDLSTAIGLETIEHILPSTIGTDTIRKSKGKIPIDFIVVVASATWKSNRLNLLSQDWARIR